MDPILAFAKNSGALNKAVAEELRDQYHLAQLAEYERQLDLFQQQ